MQKSGSCLYQTSAAGLPALKKSITRLGEIVIHAANNRLQQTLAGPVKLSGPGLFHGIHAHLRLLPADANSGITFCRTDLADTPTVAGRHDYVLKAPRRTVLGLTEDQPLVETIEHIMAALSGLRVDNCRIEIDAPEIPSFDGSSRVFCDAILETGIQQLSAPVKSMNTTQQVVQYGSGGQSLILRPYMKPLLAVTWHLNYGPRAAIPAQMYSAEVTPDIFVHEIAAARTFVLESEITALKQMGYGKHLTNKDLLVCANNGNWNNRLRWPDECVRHKLLDCIGDLALSGIAIGGHVSAVRSGHKLNHQLAAKVSQLTDDNGQQLPSAA